MIFYVYLDPQIIAIARENGELGLQSLIGILYGLRQNCFIAEFDDYSDQIQKEIKEQIDELPETFDRKLIVELVRQMQKHNRFIYCLTTEYPYTKEALTYVKEQASQALLDLILLAEESVDQSEFEGIECATLFNYQHTQFERERSKISSEGITLAASKYGEQDFLNLYLKKALRFANYLEICDKVMGEKYKGNYEYTLRVFFAWLEQILNDPRNCKIIIHCGQPGDQSRGLDAMKADLTGFKRGNFEDITLKLCIYEQPAGSDDLPHQRFIVTDQIALGLDRGMDFLSDRTRQNRDVTIDYKNNDEVNDLIASYAPSRQLEIDL
jgi:hypothetical protein